MLDAGVTGVAVGCGVAVGKVMVAVGVNVCDWNGVTVAVAGILSTCWVGCEIGAQLDKIRITSNGIKRFNAVHSR